MKRLGSSWRRYFGLYRLILRFSLMDVLIFRVNALVMGLAPIVWLATMLVFLQVIFSGVKQLGGWTFWETVFLTGTHEVIFLLTWSTFANNLRSFIDSVRTGKFDQVLLKPVSPRFLISFRSIDFAYIGSFLNVIFVFFFSFSKVIDRIDVQRIPGFIIFLFLAYLINYYVFFIFASLSLVWVNSKAFLDLIFDLTDFDRYPAEIYPLGVKVFLTFFLPILFFAYFPTAYLLGKIGIGYLLLGVLILLMLFLISNFVWKKGIKNYQSASS